MSTVDSYSFLAASTFGRDIVWRIFKVPDRKTTFYTRIGLVLSAVIALVAALYFKSVVDIWHHFGSVGTPALLIPLFFAFVGKRRMPPKIALVSVVLSGGVSLVWLLSAYFRTDGSYWLGIEPIFPGLVVSICFFIFGNRRIE
jgi:Na+/proline symporter